MSCWDAPAAMLASVGETEMPVTVGVGVGDPQPVTDNNAIGRARELSLMQRRKEFMWALRKISKVFLIDEPESPQNLWLKVFTNSGRFGGTHLYESFRCENANAGWLVRVILPPLRARYLVRHSDPIKVTGLS